MSRARKLQIFVSSTYMDLVSERQAAVEAILQAGHIPAGMELFTAGSETQWEVIKRWIDDSDALLLILGERYGSLDEKSGVSYTQKEYEYALSKGKSVFALVLHEEWIKRKYRELAADATDKYREKHGAFKATVLSLMSAFVRDEKDIRLEIIRSLSAMEADPKLGGWVRANELEESRALAIELRKTIEDLRAKGAAQEAPSYSEIIKECDGRIEELRTMDVGTKTVINQGMPNEAVVMAIASALGVVDLVLNRKFSEDPSGVFRDIYGIKVEPIMRVWGLTDSSRDLTAKGKIFLSRVNEVTVAADRCEITMTAAKN